MRPIFFAVIALSTLSQAARAGSCPLEPEKIASLEKADRQELCRRSSDARQQAESMPNTYSTLSQCDATLKMASEEARVISALAGRDNGFGARISAAQSLQPGEDSEAIVNSLHSYSNVSMASAYRAQLEARKVISDSETSYKFVSTDAASAQHGVAQAAKFESDLRSRGKNSMADIIRDNDAVKAARRLEVATDVLADIETSQACLESVQPALAASFETWKSHKAALLNPELAKVIGDKEEGRQQYVFDVLTDPSKQDLAYKIDVGCPEVHCSLIFTGVGYLLKSSTLRTIGSIVVTGLAADLAMRQGLNLGQQLREAANTAIGFNVLKTEVSRIDKGVVVPFEIPILCPAGDPGGKIPCHTAGEQAKN